MIKKIYEIEYHNFHHIALQYMLDIHLKCIYTLLEKEYRISHKVISFMDDIVLFRQCNNNLCFSSSVFFLVDTYKFALTEREAEVTVNLHMSTFLFKSTLKVSITYQYGFQEV